MCRRLDIFTAQRYGATLANEPQTVQRHKQPCFPFEASAWEETNFQLSLKKIENKNHVHKYHRSCPEQLII